MTLSARQTRQLRAVGHRLKPILIVSHLGATVLAEADRALEDHELIKVKVNAEDREEKKELLAQLCEKARAELVQLIGNVALLHRAAKKPDPRLSNLLRHKELLD